MDFFFYGTLLDSRVRRAAIGPTADRLEARPAILHGWRRVRLVGRQYPVIVPAPGRSVEGCIVGPLPASAVARLVRFEGPEYEMAEVEVASTAGEALPARTFIGSGRVRATTTEWRFDEWERKARPGFLRAIDRRGGRSA
jgi:hypothetical protein